jgi:hypothetical protein
VLLANVRDVNRHQVQITFAMARHAAVDLALIFRTPPDGPPPVRLSDERYCEFLEDLSKLGVQVDRAGTPTQSLRELRAMYEPFLVGLSRYFLFELPEIVAQQTTADNWQRSPWLQRAPGIGSLPSIRPEKHFE